MKDLRHGTHINTSKEVQNIMPSIVLNMMRTILIGYTKQRRRMAATETVRRKRFAYKSFFQPERKTTATNGVALSNIRRAVTSMFVKEHGRQQAKKSSTKRTDTQIASSYKLHYISDGEGRTSIKHLDRLFAHWSKYISLADSPTLDT